VSISQMLLLFGAIALFATTLGVVTAYLLSNL
jgi:hypothetical protein